MHFVAIFGECRYVRSTAGGPLTEGPECGTSRVLVEADSADAAMKSAKRFEHIATDWTKGMTVVKSVELATPEDIAGGSASPISFYEEHWPQRK